jgi:hypothetical protein
MVRPSRFPQLEAGRIVAKEPIPIRSKPMEKLRSELLFGTDDPFINADTSHVTKLPVGVTARSLLGANAVRIFGP